MVMRDIDRLQALSGEIKRQVEYVVKKEAFLLGKSMRGELPISLGPKPPLVQEMEDLIESGVKNIMAAIERFGGV